MSILALVESRGEEWERMKKKPFKEVSDAELARIIQGQHPRTRNHPWRKLTPQDKERIKQAGYDHKASTYEKA